MANLQVRDIPDELYSRLCGHADKQEASVNELVLEAIDRQLRHLEFHERVAAQKPIKFKISPSEMLRMERAQRDAPIEI